MAIPGKDIEILRHLAEEKRRIAEDPTNIERRDGWYRLDAGGPCRPMVLAEIGGVRDELKPGAPAVLECESERGRQLESSLRREMYVFNELRDDHVVEPYINVNWRVSTSGYGVKTLDHTAGGAMMGAKTWDHPIRDIDKDFHKLQQRSFTVDREATYTEVDKLTEIFGDTLNIRIRGGFWWTFGLTIVAIRLIGLENLMLYMFDQPEGLHRIMAFLRDDHLNYAQWLESEGLLTLNNENDYIGSGSIGYTRDLPSTDDGAVHTADQWLLLESQETVGVGPNQFQEFIFPYQAELARHFGKIYYGCCEPVHTRFDVLKRLPNLARISVSPWADEEVMASAVGMDYVYSRKPNPTLVSTEIFDEELIRNDLRKTLDLTRGQRVEIIMKDVHTLNNEPGRLAQWVELARDEISKIS